MGKCLYPVNKPVFKAKVMLVDPPVTVACRLTPRTKCGVFC